MLNRGKPCISTKGFEHRQTVFELKDIDPNSVEETLLKGNIYSLQDLQIQEFPELEKYF
jgi:hypothetical protein